MNDLSLHLLDIAQNSIRAEAKEISITFLESKANNRYEFCVSDNGKGMSEDMVQKVCDPFFTTRTTRKVGLGLPLLKQNAQMAGGDVEIRSELGKGTSTSVWYQKDNIDRPPVGKIANTLMLIITANPHLQIVYKHQTDEGDFEISTQEIQEALGDDIIMNQPPVMKYIDELISENLEDIGAENQKGG